MSDYAIDCDGVTLQYQHKVALDNLTLRLPYGGIHVFIGANGAGKSSLFRVRLGFAADDSGTARVLGHDCARLTPALRQLIGFVQCANHRPGPARRAAARHGLELQPAGICPG